MFGLVHPSPTSRDGRPYPVLGLDKPGDPDDANYRLCYQCGFPCLLTRDTHGDSLDSPGLKLVQTSTKKVASLGGGTILHWEAQVVSGCPNCGSYNYEGRNRFLPYQRRGVQRVLR